MDHFGYISNNRSQIKPDWWTHELQPEEYEPRSEYKIELIIPLVRIGANRPYVVRWYDYTAARDTIQSSVHYHSTSSRKIGGIGASHRLDTTNRKPANNRTKVQKPQNKKLQKDKNQKGIEKQRNEILEWNGKIETPQIYILLC